MLVDLDPNHQFVLLDVAGGHEVFEIIKVLKTAGFKNVRHEKLAPSFFEAMQAASDSTLLLLCTKAPSESLDLIRDLKSIREMPNFPILPILKPDQQSQFMAQASLYGVVESIPYPVHLQSLMEALAKTTRRFETSPEEKGFSVAKQAFSEGSSQKAVEAFESVRAIKKSVRTEIGLGQAWLDVNDKDKSHEFLTSASELDANNFQVQLTLLEQCIVSNDSAQNVIARVESMKNQLQLTHRIPQIVKLFIQHNTVETGLAVLNKYGKDWVEKERRMIRFYWARLLHANNQQQDAQSLLVQSVKDKDAGLETYNLLGVIASQAGQLDVAKNYYCEALALSPSDYRIIFNIALICEKQENWTDAEKFLRACLSVAPEFQKAQDHLEAITKDGKVT
jgi:tetratricopeptide (TPR) repeat protein